MPIEVRGLKEALATLNKIEPGLRKQITKDMRKIAEPALQEIRKLIPNEPPLSGMDPGGKYSLPHLKQLSRQSATGRTYWRGNEKTLPKLLLNGKKPRLRQKAGATFTSNVGTIIISANTPKRNEGGKGAAFMIADMAGTGRGGPRDARKARPNLPGSLNAEIGREGSRFMWAGVKIGLPGVEDALREAAYEIIKLADRALKEKA